MQIYINIPRNHCTVRESWNPIWVRPMTYQIDSYCYLGWHLGLTGDDKDWSAKYHGNMTVWDMRAWCWRPNLPVRQHYKVAMRAHCLKSVPVLIWPLMLIGRKVTIKKATIQVLIYIVILTHQWTANTLLFSQNLLTVIFDFTLAGIHCQNTTSIT